MCQLTSREAVNEQSSAHPGLGGDFINCLQGGVSTHRPTWSVSIRLREDPTYEAGKNTHIITRIYAWLDRSTKAHKYKH